MTTQIPIGNGNLLVGLRFDDHEPDDCCIICSIDTLAPLRQFCQQGPLVDTAVEWSPSNRHSQLGDTPGDRPRRSWES